MMVSRSYHTFLLLDIFTVVRGNEKIRYKYVRKHPFLYHGYLLLEY